ncbi:MAG TPA: hypothetical protein VF135_14555 [Terriglobales bacterium]
MRRVREAAGENLDCMILYGSAASGDYHPEFSNVNLFCILRETSFGALQKLAPAVQWWQQQKQPAPLLMTRAELEATTDVFTIELLDMQRHHRVLFGNDVLAGLSIPMKLHRVQVEYELREKLILLRQKSLMTTGDKQLWELLVRSASSFATLFRHALIALGEEPKNGKRDSVEQLAKKVGFDATAVHKVLDVREKKIEMKNLDVKDLFARYLAAIEIVTAAVDKALDRA